jgi:hypothetical protein
MTHSAFTHDVTRDPDATVCLCMCVCVRIHYACVFVCVYNGCVFVQFMCVYTLYVCICVYVYMNYHAFTNEVTRDPDALIRLCMYTHAYIYKDVLSLTHMCLIFAELRPLLPFPRLRQPGQHAQVSFFFFVHTYINTYMHAYICTRLAMPCSTSTCSQSSLFTYIHACMYMYRACHVMQHLYML